MSTEVDVRRSADRFLTSRPGVESRHSFSFGPHYDSTNTSYALLLACNEEVLAAGAGFEPHPHRDVEIVTWVLEGALQHEDSTGSGGLITPGTAQRMSAGDGVVHAERNAGPGPLRFVQTWVRPDGSSRVPSYEQAEVVWSEGLVAVASGRPADSAAVSLSQRDATFLVGRLGVGQVVDLPDAPWLHLLVATGSVELERAGALLPGDAARLTGGGGQRLTALDPAEVLVWAMRSDGRS
jgi:redox-sensitive bicupin YhaK (pirin superfamily)